MLDEVLVTSQYQKCQTPMRKPILARSGSTRDVAWKFVSDIFLTQYCRLKESRYDLKKGYFVCFFKHDLMLVLLRVGHR